MNQPLPYDPDFDKPKNLKDIGSQFPPKTVFLFGILAAVLALSTIGFFILLGVMLKGGASFSSAGKLANAVLAAAGALQKTVFHL